MHVGEGPSRARFRLTNPHEVGRVLADLTLEARGLVRETRAPYLR